ncbi:MAG: hypothetical protein ACRD4U_12035 [Candidatus Acidiferrales bacterium]
MRLTAPAWAKTLLTVLLLVHLLVHPSLHAVATLADRSPEISSPAGTNGEDAAGEGRAPCLACRIGSSALVTAVAAEPLSPSRLSERLPVVDLSFVFRLSSSPVPSRAPPLG